MQTWLPPAKGGMAHFSAFLGLADSGIPGCCYKPIRLLEYNIMHNIIMIIWLLGLIGHIYACTALVGCTIIEMYVEAVSSWLM